MDLGIDKLLMSFITGDLHESEEVFTIFPLLKKVGFGIDDITRFSGDLKFCVKASSVLLYGNSHFNSIVSNGIGR